MIYSNSVMMLYMCDSMIRPLHYFDFNSDVTWLLITSLPQLQFRCNTHTYIYEYWSCLHLNSSFVSMALIMFLPPFQSWCYEIWSCLYSTSVLMLYMCDSLSARICFIPVYMSCTYMSFDVISILIHMFCYDLSWYFVITLIYILYYLINSDFGYDHIF